MSFGTCPNFLFRNSRPNEDGYRMSDGLPDRKELHIFKAIYLLKYKIFVWGIDQPDDSLCPDHCIRRST